MKPLLTENASSFWLEDLGAEAAAAAEAACLDIAVGEALALMARYLATSSSMMATCCGCVVYNTLWLKAKTLDIQRKRKMENKDFKAKTKQMKAKIKA